MPAPSSDPGATGPAGSVRTAVVWDVLSSELAGLAGLAGRAGGAQRVDGADGAGGLDILDAGGGTGGFAVPLAVAGHRVTVVDPSPDSLAALARRAADHGVSHLVTGVQGDLDDLSAPASVDLVLCHSVLEYVEDPRAALSAVAAALRPGGLLSLLVANRAAAVLARALSGHLAEAARILQDRDGRGGPADRVTRRFALEDLRWLLTGADLHLEQVHGVRVLADLVPSTALDLEPGGPAALLALERTLSAQPPYRDLATQLHLLARRD